MEQRGQSWMSETDGSGFVEWNRAVSLGGVEHRSQSWMSGTGGSGLGRWNRGISTSMPADRTKANHTQNPRGN